jgi:hypothetical protein
MINKHFPTSYDVDQALTYRTTSFVDLRRFMQSLGIIVVGNSKDQIAEFASNILFEHQDYLIFRRLAQGASSATNISGFSLRSKLVPISQEDLIADLNELREQLIQQEQELIRKGAPALKVSSPQIVQNRLQLKFEYQRVIPGRVELMQRVDTEVILTVEPISTNNWRVICFPQANQDVKRVEKLFQKMAKGSYEPTTISLEQFTRQQRIQFFDDILDYYSSHDEWRFEQVTEITVRQDVSPKNEYLFGENGVFEEDVFLLVDEEENYSEAQSGDLRSITQAILQGENLRTNSFVKRCESQGFYFPSMTLKLENRKSLEIVEVNIRFKLSPHMFEVVLTNMNEKSDVGEMAANFTEQRQQEILKEFWDTSHLIWENIYQHVPQPIKQLSLVDAPRVIS